MRINEVIKLSNYNWNHVVELINNNCSNALESCKKASSFLYHGSGNRVSKDSQLLRGNYIIADTKIRKPAISFPYAEEKLIDAGFIALRSNSIFCTGDYLFAANFGEVYTIFPFNSANFTWSERYLNYFSDDVEMPFDPERFDNEFKYMSPMEFVKVCKMRKDNLTEAILSEHEIYVHGKFLAIRYSAFDSEKWMELIKYEDR